MTCPSNGWPYRGWVWEGMFPSAIKAHQGSSQDFNFGQVVNNTVIQLACTTLDSAKLATKILQPWAIALVAVMEATPLLLLLMNVT